jgi:hypothetical protein
LEQTHDTYFKKIFKPAMRFGFLFIPLNPYKEATKLKRFSNEMLFLQLCCCSLTAARAAAAAAAAATLDHTAYCSASILYMQGHKL